MKTITVRDLRQRWPKAESMLEREKELIVTHDAQQAEAAEAVGFEVLAAGRPSR